MLKETGQNIRLEEVINYTINRMGQHQHGRISITYWAGNARINVYIETLWPKKLLLWKTNKQDTFRVGTCSLRYPARKVRVSYCTDICDLSSSSTFFHMFHTRHDFR